MTKYVLNNTLVDIPCFWPTNTNSLIIKFNKVLNLRGKGLKEN